MGFILQEAATSDNFNAITISFWVKMDDDIASLGGSCILMEWGNGGNLNGMPPHESSFVRVVRRAGRYALELWLAGGSFFQPAATFGLWNLAYFGPHLSEPNYLMPSVPAGFNLITGQDPTNLFSYWQSKGPAGGVGDVVMIGDPSSYPDFGYHLDYVNYTVAPGWVTRSVRVATTIGGQITPGQWHHIFISYDGGGVMLNDANFIANGTNNTDYGDPMFPLHIYIDAQSSIDYSVLADNKLSDGATGVAGKMCGFGRLTAEANGRPNPDTGGIVVNGYPWNVPRFVPTPTGSVIALSQPDTAPIKKRYAYMMVWDQYIAPYPEFLGEFIKPDGRPRDKTGAAAIGAFGHPIFHHKGGKSATGFIKNLGTGGPFGGTGTRNNYTPGP